MKDVIRESQDKANKLRKEIKREQEQQPNRIIAPPIFPPPKREPKDEE